MSGTTRLGVIVTMSNQQALAGLRDLRDGIARLTNELPPLEGKLRSIDRILTYMATATMVGLTAQFVRMSAELERMQILLLTTEGTIASANARMDQMLAIASRAPFSLQAITDAFVKLKTAGIEPITGADGSGPLQALIDGLSAFGGTEQQLQRATIALQQMAGKGVISLEELRQQLGEAIPTAMRLMAEGLGMTTAQLISEISKGNIEAQRGINALTRMMQEKYGGAAELLSMSMSGAFRQLTTQINRTSLELQRMGVFDVITTGMRNLTAALERFNNMLRDTGSGALAEFFQWIDRNAEVIARFISSLGQFGLAIGIVFQSIANALSLLPAEVIAGGILGFILFGRAGAVIGALLGSIDGFVVAIAGAISGILSTLTAFASAIGFDLNTFTTMGILGLLIFGKTGLLVGGIIGLADQAIGQLRRAIAGLFATFIQLYTTARELISGNFSNPFQVGADAFRSFIERNGSQAGQTFGNLSMTPLQELFSRGGDAARVNAERVREFNAAVQQSMTTLQEARREFEGRFGSPNERQGLTQQEIDQVRDITSAYERMGDRLRSLQGREIDGFLSARQRELERLRGIIGNVTERANQAEAGGRAQEAAQLRAEAQSLTQQADAFERIMDRIRQADAGRVGQRAALVLDRYGNQLQSIRQQLEAAMAEFTGGRESENAEVERIEARFSTVARSLANLRTQVEATRGSEASRSATLAEIIELQGLLNRVTEQGIAIAQRKAAREREDAQREAQRAVQDAETGLRREQLNRSQNPFSSRELTILDRAEGYRRTIQQIDDQLLELRRRMEDRGPNVEPWVQQQLEGLQRVRDAYQGFYDAVGSFQEEEAIRARELWSDVSDAVTDSFGQTLEMLITRTGSLKDITEDLFRSISRSVANYMSQLAISQLGGMFGGAFGGAGGGTFSIMKLFSGIADGGAKLASANGNVFVNGNVQRFANGGAFTNRVVAGPTLFNIGEMGEEGPEGIMPLARVGGKLGVHAKGGGDNISINIQAVDSDSVRALFMREGGALVSALQGRMRLNRGVR